MRRKEEKWGGVWRSEGVREERRREEGGKPILPQLKADSWHVGRPNTSDNTVLIPSVLWKVWRGWTKRLFPLTIRPPMRCWKSFSVLKNRLGISQFFIFLFINVSVFEMSVAKHYEKHINQEKCKTFSLKSAFWKRKQPKFG